jgi:hypothetical protein
MPDILTFNQFQKELRDRGIEGPMAYILTTMYERMSHMSSQMDELASLQLALANSMEGFVALHAQSSNDMDQLKARIGGFGKTPGVDVHSVANEPED